MHIFNHLLKSSCTICNETIVQLGNTWYSPHKHSNQGAPVETGVETLTFVDTSDRIQMDPFSTKNETNAICNIRVDDGFIKTKHAECSTSNLSIEDIAEVETELIKAPEHNDLLATNSGNSSSTKSKYKIPKSRSAPIKSSANIEAGKQKAIAKVKRQNCSISTTKKCSKYLECNEEFLEYQKEREKSPCQNRFKESQFDDDYETTIQKSNETVIDKMNTHRKACKNPRSVHDDDVEILTYEQIKNLTEDQPNSLKCPICNKMFAQQRGLKSHLRVHKTIYTCKLCRKIFPTMDEYGAHKSTVHDEIVDQSSEQLSNANTQVCDANDDDAIEWICEYCNGDFELELALAKHVEKDHSTVKSEHLCNICTETFNDLRVLLAHMRAHRESKQHECPINGCDHAFAYKASLVIHLNKHKMIDDGKHKNISPKWLNNMQQLVLKL